MVPSNYFYNLLTNEILGSRIIKTETWSKTQTHFRSRWGRQRAKLSVEGISDDDGLDHVALLQIRVELSLRRHFDEKAFLFRKRKLLQEVSVQKL